MLYNYLDFIVLKIYKYAVRRLKMCSYTNKILQIYCTLVIEIRIDFYYEYALIIITNEDPETQ